MPNRPSLALAALLLSLSPSSAQNTFLLNDFNNNGMDVLSGGFNQQLGQFATRFFDNADGAGVAASLLGGVDLGGLASGGSLKVRYNPLSGHATDFFTVDLYDSQSNFLSYAVDTTVPSLGGAFGAYDVSLDIASPTGGSAPFAEFDFTDVASWAISGQPGSAGPFNVNLFNVELEGNLPDPPVNYGGLDPTSPWRAEAATRIDQIRKADLSLRVVDQNGAPVSGAAVRVRQTRQAFQFGTAVAVDNLLGSSPNDQIYRDRLLEMFNTATIENGLKWDPLAGDWGPSWSLAESVQALDWLQQNGLQSRGHVLIWPGSQNMPSYLDPLIAAAKSGDTQARQGLLAEIHDHIVEVVSATDGKVVDWDVVNEIGTNNDVLNIYGEAIMDTWFGAARQTDPDAKLFINEFNIISDEQRSKRAQYLASIQGLVDRGAEIDGIGMQAHFHDYSLTDLDGTGGSDPQTVWEVLDSFHDATGLPITITEFDVNSPNETLKANYLRDFLTAVFAHEGVDGFLMWGFWEGRHWRPDAALYNQDWSETPSVQVWRDLVLGEWMTDEQLTSTTEGTGLRAFKGDYEVVVQLDGETNAFDLTLGDGGLATELVLPIDVSQPGDYDGDGDVDQDDFQSWSLSYGDAAVPFAGADGNGDGVIDAADYTVWRDASVASPDAIPEPVSGALAVIAWCGVGSRPSRSRATP
ncbi:endo-1,4-beta-xylanase [Botrimarina sp.]|uniref:endo-1,4-beta-xylanase n=1 Tax=Botrimarina sp. TaxID=2795802 RepID=UPI0032F069B9